MPNVTRKIDWLTITHHNTKKWERFIPITTWDEIGEPTKPLPHYQKAWKLLPAGRVDIAHDDKQGVMITFGGSDLSDWIAAGISFDYLMAEAKRIGKVTRIDFATDVRAAAGESRLWELVKGAITERSWKSRMRPRAQIADQTEGGFTQYFGSYKSDRFIRIYDKFAESGLLLQAMKQHLPIEGWTRVESVNRGEYAQNLHTDMLKHGWQKAGTSHLRKSLSFPNMPDWEQVVSGEPVDITPLSAKEPKWRKWMQTQVETSILEHAENPDDLEFLLGWMGFLTDKLWKLKYERDGDVTSE